MQTWNAGQIGASGGAYTGRDVAFMDDGDKVGGVLTRSERAPEGQPYTYLWVDGEFFKLANTALVEVA